MKYIRHYKVFESEENNIVKQFNINGISNIIQEIFDDLEVNEEETIIYPCHICKKGEYEDLMGNVVFDTNHVKYKFMIGAKDKESYFVKFPDNSIDLDKIDEIMKHKSELYGFRYSILKKEEYIKSGQYEWRPISGLLIF